MGPWTHSSLLMKLYQNNDSKITDNYSQEEIVQVFHIQMFCPFMSVYFLCFIILRHNRAAFRRGWVHLLLKMEISFEVLKVKRAINAK